MGMGYEFQCKCGYSFRPFLGVGFLFPKVYQETIAAVREGKCGEELKVFLQEHPDGAVNAEIVVVRCRDCGEYSCAPDLSMYLRTKAKRKPKGIWSAAMPFENEEYVSPSELKTAYELYAPYRHKCGSCGGDMERVNEEELKEKGIICPRCGQTLTDYETIFWD